jgi:hypothetical protein
VNCNFCGKTARMGRAFCADDSGRGGCICHDCVRDLYIAMIAEEMRPPPPAREITAVRPAAARAQVIPLHPRKDY